MRFWVLTSLLVICVAGFFWARTVRPKAGDITYYVQLVRACDANAPPEPNSKRIGHPLLAKLQGPLRWENYWEINRKEVTLAPGHAARLRLCRKCEVEIDLTQKGHRRVTAIENGKIIQCVTKPMGESMTLIGGDWDSRSGWFIAVRRDRPSVSFN